MVHPDQEVGSRADLCRILSLPDRKFAAVGFVCIAGRCRHALPNLQGLIAGVNRVRYENTPS